MKKIAILIDDQFQDLEVWYPFLRLMEAGHQVHIVGYEKRQYQGKNGIDIKAIHDYSELKEKTYDAVIIPGGWAVDYMRRREGYRDAVAFVNDMYDAGKIVASICHGGWFLASCDFLRGKTVTGFISIKDDLENAGAEFVDGEVVVDGNLITSRNPLDLPFFLREIQKQLA